MKEKDNLVFEPFKDFDFKKSKEERIEELEEENEEFKKILVMFDKTIEAMKDELISLRKEVEEKNSRKKRKKRTEEIEFVLNEELFKTI